MRHGSLPGASNYFDHSLESGDINFFVERDYTFIIPDPRGIGESQGEFLGIYNPQEQEDLYDTIEWAGTRCPWSTEKVSLLGYSYFGIVQALAAALQPPHPGGYRYEYEWPLRTDWKKLYLHTFGQLRWEPPEGENLEPDSFTHRPPQITTDVESLMGRPVHDYSQKISENIDEIREFVIEINPLGMVFLPDLPSSWKLKLPIPLTVRRALGRERWTTWGLFPAGVLSITKFTGTKTTPLIS